MIRLFEICQNKQKFVKLKEVKPLWESAYIKDAEHVARFCIDVLQLNEYATEHFYVLPVTTKAELLGVVQISSGSINYSLVPVDKVFQAALQFNATNIIVVHNHPSGDSTPSEEDLRVTEGLKEAGKLLGVSVLDHVVIGDGEYYSINSEDGGFL